MPKFDVKNTEASIRFVLERLRTSPGKWLLVFDNFDDPSSFHTKSIKEYFPRSRDGSILVTSRVREATFLGNAIDVSVMSNEEAVELLFQRSKRDEARRSATDLLEAPKIVARLGFHALAIDQAGAYIFSGDYDLDVFLNHYNKRRMEVLSAKPSLWDYRRKLQPDSDFETELTVFTTWELSFELITGDEKVRDDKEHILTLMAFLDGKKISNTLFEPYHIENDGWMISCIQDGVWDEFKFQDILKELRNLSLIQSLRIQGSRAIMSLHPLVQDWIKLRISPDSRWAYATEAIHVVSKFIVSQEFHEKTFDDRQTTAAHILAIVQNAREYLHQQDDEDESILRGYHYFSDFLADFGQYREAEQLYRQTQALTERVIGKEHPNALTYASNFALFLQGQGRYDEAELLHRQALALRKKILSPEHPDTLTSMNNLASLLKSQGKYNEAKLLHRQALALSKKILGLKHPNTLTSMNNLALVLESQGKYDEAEPLYRQTLALSKKILGPEHPDMLISINNFAGLLESQGKYDEAELLYRKTIASREKVLGLKHPDTLLSMNDLAYLLKGQGKHDDAEQLYRKALALREVLGPNHPDTLLVEKNLAALLRIRDGEGHDLTSSDDNSWETMSETDSEEGGD